ncbi:hypothetical protein ACXR2T_08110 [Leucobacter sp. HY1910]
MFGLFGKKTDDLAPAVPGPHEIAALVKGDPAMRAAFERAYAAHDDGFTAIGPSLATARANAAAEHPADAEIDDDLVDAIVADLLAVTRTWTTGNGWRNSLPELTDGSPSDHTAQAMQKPESVRPQATGDAIMRDLDAPSTPIVLLMLARSLDEALSPKERRQAYHQFRQGLEILDLDGGLYDMLLSNPDSIGHWLPALAHAAETTAFRVPDTTVAQVPMPLLQLARIAYEEINPTTHAIINRWAMEAFGLRLDGDYFLKTGVFSSKFDFRNARVNDPQEIPEIGDYLLYTQHLAGAMAGPLSPRPTYGAGTTAEWAVRRFVPADPDTPTIYHGMPLRCELRVFIDCDTNQVLSVVPYWDPATMKRRFSEMEDADHPDNRHDMVAYLMAEEGLMSRFDQLRAPVAQMVEEMLPRLDLPGQWSLDVMSQGDDLWLIDMARAQTSAFYDTVLEALRRPTAEDWLARLQPELDL